MADNKNQKAPVKSTPAAKSTTTTSRTTPAAKPAATTTRTTPAAKPAATTARTTPAAKSAATTTRTTPAAKSTTTTSRTTPAAKPAATTARTTPAAKSAATTTRTTPAAKSTPEVRTVKAADPAEQVKRAAQERRFEAADRRQAQAKDTVVAGKGARISADTVQDKPKATNRKTAKKTGGSDNGKNGKNGKGGKANAAAKSKEPMSVRMRIILIAVAALLAVGILLTVILVSCNGGENNAQILSYRDGGYSVESKPADNAFVSEDDIQKGSFDNAYKNRTKVGYNAEYLGTAVRKRPLKTDDEGLVRQGVIEAYPKFGYTSAYTAEQKSAVIGESWMLSGIRTRIGSDGYPKNTYDRIMSDGKLYLEGTDTGKVLYKHTAADGMYYGNVDDTEPGIVKRLTYLPRANGVSYNVTGLYAPAGEVIKVELTAADMDATGGIEVLIGQALYNKKANNIWAARNINRMPVILNTLWLTKDTCMFDNERNVWVGYVGSFYGGPIYVYNETVKFSVTISGGVRYAHYILGYTTPDEYADNLNSSAPYFDVEVRENGVLHSGPKKSAGDTSYENIHNAAVLWEKISLVSTQRGKQGIVFLYDPFVAAGAAVAFPGQKSVNCPAGWMSGSLNYNSFVRSGAWGNIHEYNHNFQGYGCNGNDGEVTNNALSLVEYSLFTNISSARRIGSFGGEGLGGWNSYTSATWALNLVNTGNIGGTSGLAMYATLMHNFGQEAFISASLGGRGVNYFQKWGEVTHNNMAYFLELAKVYSLSGDGTNNTIDYSPLKETQKSYPMFVPVSSVYQTGRSYMYDGAKKYITTMRPYNIEFGKTFDVDLRPYTSEDGMYKSGSVVIPQGFTYKIKKVIAPKYGKLTKKSDNVFAYTPDPKHMQSGKMVVTLGIVKNDGAFKVDDVDLVLEFKQSHEMNKNMLERTVYTFEEGTAPESATAAFDSGYKGYSDKQVVDNVNPVQNGNTEIWSSELLPDNTFYEVKGKIHIGETAKYRIALRGRWDCALYTAVNEDKNYTLAATVKTEASHANFYLNDPATYRDMTDLKAGDWLYFKAVLKGTHKGGTNAYIGVGFGQFVPPQGVLDENGNLIGSDGNIIENPQETIRVSYANAYRASYEEVHEEFITDYFYLGGYKYTYKSDDVTEYSDGQSIVETNFVPWNDNYKADNLFDGDPNTTAHTQQHQNGKPETSVTADNPLNISVDAGKTITANCFTVYARNDSANKTGLPIDFKLELRDTKDGKVKYSKTFTGVTHAVGGNVEVTLGKEVSFRYYTLTVTRSENNYFVASAMCFSSRRFLDNGTVFEADNAMFKYDGNWEVEQGLYTFGHVYEGKGGATLKFTFTGEAFAVFAYNGERYGSFDVYIDGKKAGTVTQNGEEPGSQRMFLSEPMKSGKHSVEIRCNNGVVNIDNIVLW